MSVEIIPVIMLSALLVFMVITAVQSIIDHEKWKKNWAKQMEELEGIDVQLKQASQQMRQDISELEELTPEDKPRENSTALQKSLKELL